MNNKHSGSRASEFFESNPTVVRKKDRKKLKCSICPPNRGCNINRRAKHGNQKPKSKNKRRLK